VQVRGQHAPLHQARHDQPTRRNTGLLQLADFPKAPNLQSHSCQAVPERSAHYEKAERTVAQTDALALIAKFDRER
jgi:hypothetical protein